MRIFNIAVAMTLASYVHAQQDLDLEDMNDLDEGELQDLEDDWMYDTDEHIDYGDDDMVPEDYEGDVAEGRRLQKR